MGGALSPIQPPGKLRHPSRNDFVLSKRNIDHCSILRCAQFDWQYDLHLIRSRPKRNGTHPILYPIAIAWCLGWPGFEPLRVTLGTASTDDWSNGHAGGLVLHLRLDRVDHNNRLIQSPWYLVVQKNDSICGSLDSLRILRTSVYSCRKFGKTMYQLSIPCCHILVSCMRISSGSFVTQDNNTSNGFMRYPKCPH